MPELGAQFGQQQSLFDKETVPHFQDLPPHLQTREQFEASPGTWFHSSRQTTIPSDVDTGLHPARAPVNTKPQPFHAGTVKAAMARTLIGHAPSWSSTHRDSLDVMSKRAGFGGGSARPWMHSFRNVGPMKEGGNRSDEKANTLAEGWNTRASSPAHQRLDLLSGAVVQDGPWEGTTKGLYYTNDVEDVGSTSIVVHGTKGLKSHGDYVQEAKARGDRVSPIAEAQSVLPSGRLLHPEEFKEHGVKPEYEPTPHPHPDLAAKGKTAPSAQQLKLFDTGMSAYGSGWEGNIYPTSYAPPPSSGYKQPVAGSMKKPPPPPPGYKQGVDPGWQGPIHAADPGWQEPPSKSFDWVNPPFSSQFDKVK